MRNNLDGDVTKSYRMNTQFMFECVLCCSGATPSVFPLDLVFFSFHLVFECFLWLSSVFL